MIVAGQPGAGKGVIVEHVSRLMVEQGYCVVVDPDELKYFHPAYAVYADRDDRQVMMEIGSQIWQAADALISAAVQRRANLVIATHLAQPTTATELASQLRRSSYHVTVVALCVEPEASWLSVQERLDRQQQAFEVGTWVRREYYVMPAAEDLSIRWRSCNLTTVSMNCTSSRGTAIACSAKPLTQVSFQSPPGDCSRGSGQVHRRITHSRLTTRGLCLTSLKIQRPRTEVSH